MSKLSEMIARLCPNGVEYRKIKDTFKRLRGTPITAGQMKQIQNDDGEIMIFAGGKTAVRAKEKDILRANITRVPAVLVQSRGIIDFIYCDKPFTFKNEMWAYTADDPITVKYLYYVLQNNAKAFREAASGMGALPQISLKVTEDFPIPLPPLPVQREIVQILDNFANLTAELTAELAKRKKQYEHYRDMLLNFTGGGRYDKFGNECVSPHIEWKRLGEVAEIGTGSSNTDEQLEKGVYPFFVRSQEVRWKNEFEYDETAIITSGDGVGVGKIFHFYEGKYALHQRAYRIHIVSDEFLPKYVFYYMKNGFLKYIERNAFQSSVTSIRRPMLLNFQLPLISIAEQKRIVDILDRFDSLCNSLTEGLPAEIALRKKQYEYYRDKLLSFKEAS